MNIQELTNGRWPDLLAHFCGLTAKQLSDKHQPCPLCGGEDRYRFDDIDGTGSWYCNQCGGKDHAGGGGSGMDMLMRHQKWPYPEACKRIEQHLGIRPEPPIPRGKQYWRYNDDFYVYRKEMPDGGKQFRPIWFDGTEWKFKAPPAPRPLYNRESIAARPDAPVLIVEGEKTADAAAKLFPHAVVITWPSGCQAHGKADWAPIANRNCVLWPDADEIGRDAMAKLVPRLVSAGAAQIRMVQPPSDVASGWDLADCDWTAAEAGAYYKANRTPPIEFPAVIKAEPLPEPALEPPPLLKADDSFLCLGFDADAYYYQPHSTGQVTRLSRSAHSGINLVALAPLPYWESLYPSKVGVNWTAAASSLFARQADIGVYSPDRIRGRGAWWDQKQSVLHLGDKLVVDGTNRPIRDGINGSPYLYQRLSALRGCAGAEPLTDNEAFAIAELAERFHWEVPASGLLLAGWVVLGPICGALDWRPHVWLTASAGSGKSAVLGRYVTPLLGDMGLIVTGNTTEPGIRQALRADALPVVFDEAESNERNDQARMQAILGLARVASSESRAHTLKGSPEGDTQRYTIRSMFMMSSIATALKQGADKSRFAQLTLRSHTEIPKAERLAHWESLDRDLDKYISDAIGRRLQARTIKLIPTIRKSIAIFTRAAAEVFDSQRLGDQYGTLLAGAWSLQSSEVATRDEAWKLIEQNNWESYSQSVEISDEKRCLQRILQHQLRVEGDKTVTRTIGELIDIALNHAHDLQVGASEAQAVIGRNGIKAEDTAIYISNTADSIGNILRDTPWANCWAVILARIPNAAKAGVIYFKGSGMSGRAVKIPLEAAQA